MQIYDSTNPAKDEGLYALKPVIALFFYLIHVSPLPSWSHTYCKESKDFWMILSPPTAWSITLF